MPTAAERITLSYAANTISVATQDGRTVTATLAGGLVVSLTGPGARTSPSYTYTAGSTAQLATVTDGRGKVWQYEYDSNGRMTQAKTPERAAAGVAVTNTYDTSGRIATQTIPLNPAAGGATPQQTLTTFTYSGNYPNMRTDVTTDSIVTRYEYVAGLLTQKGRQSAVAFACFLEL